MGNLSKLEKRLIGGGTHYLGHILQTAVHAFSDYKHRHVGSSAASVSFYAIFSVFPLLAFCVYLVGKMVGTENTSHSAGVVLKILRDFLPAMQAWIEKGLFEVMKGNAVTNGVNAVLLGWSGMGLFSALLSAIEHLPGRGHHAERAHVTQAALGFSVFGLFTVFMASVIFCELVGKSAQIPFFLQGLPFAAQDVLYALARTRALMIVASVGVVTMLFKLLLPVKVRMRSAFTAALLFAGLLMLSRSAYWIYLHYNKHAIDSTYGVFSTLILIMLWVHYTTSCMLYSCLFSLHLDRSVGYSQHVGSDDQGHGAPAESHGHDDHGGGHSHAA